MKISAFHFLNNCGNLSFLLKMGNVRRGSFSLMLFLRPCERYGQSNLAGWSLTFLHSRTSGKGGEGVKGEKESLINQPTWFMFGSLLILLFLCALLIYFLCLYLFKVFSVLECLCSNALLEMLTHYFMISKLKMIDLAVHALYLMRRLAWIACITIIYNFVVYLRRSLCKSLDVHTKYMQYKLFLF